MCNIAGVVDISCGAKLGVACNSNGEVFAWNDTQLLGLTGKERHSLQQIYNPQRFHSGHGGGGSGSGNKKKSSSDNKISSKSKLPTTVYRIVTLSQIGRVFASSNCVFVIQSFLWPQRNLRAANLYQKGLQKSIKFRKTIYHRARK